MGKMSRKWKKSTWILLWCGILILTAGAGLLAGSVPLPPDTLWKILTDWENTKEARIMLYVRLPRVAGAMFAGAGLAAAGTVIQSVLNNPLAGPNIIGVNAGAGFAVVLFGAFCPGRLYLMPAAAFAGALVTVLLVYYTARKTGASRITLVLAGVAVNSFLNAASDAVTVFVPDAVMNRYAFRIGGLNGVSTKILVPACLMIILSLAAVFCLSHELDLLQLGEEVAGSLGLKVGKYRFILLLLAAVLAGASVSFAGLISFVGLIVPHMARMWAGTESRWLLPLSALMGASLLTLCDLIARKAFAPYDISVGIVLSFLGAPYFIYLLIRKKGRGIRD